MTATATAAVSTAVSIATPDPVTIFSVLTTDPPHSETSTAAVWILLVSNFKQYLEDYTYMKASGPGIFMS